LYAIRETATLVGFPNSDDRTNENVLLADNLLVRSPLQRLGAKDGYNT
jgi:hypothetical protein